MSRTGACVCGAITFVATGELRGVLHCHCVNCRRASGNFVASIGCATSELRIDDSDARLNWFDLGYCRYGFCSTCGSRLFWQGAEHRDRTSVQVGTLDDASGLDLQGVWFADDAQTHNVVDPTVPRFSGNGSA